MTDKILSFAVQVAKEKYDRAAKETTLAKMAYEFAKIRRDQARLAWLEAVKAARDTK